MVMAMVAIVMAMVTMVMAMVAMVMACSKKANTQALVT